MYRRVNPSPLLKLHSVRFSSTAAAPAAAAAASTAAPTQPRKKFNPSEIYPSKAGHVRICSNTTRDAQQSNLSAEMAANHRIEIAKMIDDCYKNIQGPPGVEQVWGGTIPMFDLWKRGVHPFDSLRELTSYLPNTPTSMLVRSNSLNSMNSQPRDVVDSFIKLAVDGGVNVFTNFDANNDPRNHVAVAEAVHKYGQHYQAALSWAVYHADPTVYNVKWAVNWFKRIVNDLAPHSLYVKDPSGVLTPEMAGLLAREIKAEFPNLPLVFHTHYQTGFAYAAYLEAMRNGANGVECSLGFPDGAGQPYSLSMLRMVEDFGLETGNPDKQKMHAINLFCKTNLRPLYASANVVRTPDIEVEKTGIAGGQRSILDKELIDAGQANLIPIVDTMVQQVRKEGGLVCQVTPAADSYAREAMRRIRGGDATKGFTPGYAQILFGENGSTKEPVHPDQRRVALDERVAKKAKEMVTEKRIAKATVEALNGFNGLTKPTAAELANAPIALWRTRMDELAAPVILQQRIEEVEARIGELNFIASKPDLLKSLNIKIAAAAKNAKEGSVEKNIKTVADRIAILQAELAGLNKQNKGSADAADKYHGILLGGAADAEYVSLINLSPVSANLYQSGKLTLANVKELITYSGTITCSASALLENSLEKSAREIALFEENNCLGLLDTPQKKEENTLLWACFSRAAIPNLIENFFLNYYTGDIAGFFPKLYKGDKTDGKTGTLKARLAKDEEKSQFLFRQIHKTVEGIVKAQRAKMTQIKELQKQAQLLSYRLDKWKDGSVESSRIAPETIARLTKKIESLNAEAQKETNALVEVLKEWIKTNPGKLAPSYPEYNKQACQIDFVPSSTQQIELQLATDALKQIIMK